LSWVDCRIIVVRRDFSKTCLLGTAFYFQPD
jgi:hypothetical protein